jgi:hypothetical protein
MNTRLQKDPAALVAATTQLDDLKRSSVDLCLRIWLLFGVSEWSTATKSIID